MKRHVPKLFRAGFTLVEIMVAMSVLAVLVMMIGNIFQQVSDSWNIGTQSADANTAARAALNFMAQELSQAVAGPIEAAPGINATYIEFSVLGGTADLGGNELKFFTMTEEPNADDNQRALRSALFRFEENALKYWRNTGSKNPYTDSPAWDSSRVLITNVVDFQVFVYSNKNDFTSAGGAMHKDVDVFTNALPACLDIYLGILSEGDMARWQRLSEPAKTEFCDRNVQSYATRVYFQNRQGYAAR